MNEFVPDVEGQFILWERGTGTCRIRTTDGDIMQISKGQVSEEAHVGDQLGLRGEGFCETHKVQGLYDQRNGEYYCPGCE